MLCDLEQVTNLSMPYFTHLLMRVITGSTPCRYCENQKSYLLYIKIHKHRERTVSCHCVKSPLVPDLTDMVIHQQTHNVMKKFLNNANTKMLPYNIFHKYF